jgi:hypothetical protein
MSFAKKPKRAKAIWTQAFPSQAAALRPEKSKAGGAKWRSQPKAVEDAVYAGINALFAAAHPTCECCSVIWPDNLVANIPHSRDDTHHIRGKLGLLYFDVRWFKSTCRKAHVWIGSNIEKARELGLIADSGDWRKASE